jgi:tetratricopeptide (TPR) repeat protein
MIGAISGHTASILTGLDSGFSMLGGRMDMIAEGISELNASFQWGFGRMIAQMAGMNATLQQLLQIARTPVQTWAYNQFDIARDNFRKGLYDNCIKRLDKAINGDQTSPGYEEEWRFHRMIGVVRLGFFGCETNLIDLPQAEREFLLAARYAQLDEPKEAAKSFLSAGWTAFVQANLKAALAYTEQAIALDANLTEAYFQAAKILMAANEPERALPMLRKAIDQAPGYLVKAAADGDFRRHQERLDSFCMAVRQEIFSALATTVRQTLNETVEWARTIHEVAEYAPVFDRWRELQGGSWGLLVLANYRKDGFDLDRQSVANARLRGLARLEEERKTAAEKRVTIMAAERAAAEAAQHRKRERARGGALIGSWIGAVVMGLSGCVSCLNHHVPTGSFPITPFNLFTGLIIGAATGAVLGYALGFMME